MGEKPNKVKMMVDYQNFSPIVATGNFRKLEMITVFGRSTSSNVQLVMWALAELGLKVDRIDVGGKFGGTDTDEYRAMNPNSLVPVLKDGDHIMFESAAILRYLGAEYGDDTFWPKDNKQRGKLDVIAEWSKTSVCSVLIYNIFWTLIRTPSHERDWDNFAVQVSKMADLMTIAEHELEGKTYLSGDKLTFADIMFGHALYRYYTLEFDRKHLPNLKAYYDRLCQREAYREHVMVDYSSLQVE